jgi:hypothetical protein
MPYALQLPAYIVARLGGSGGGGGGGSSGRYMDGVRHAIRGGGCNSSRAGLVGAILGAVDGVEAVPSAWIALLSEGEAMLATAAALATTVGGQQMWRGEAVGMVEGSARKATIARQTPTTARL